MEDGGIADGIGWDLIANAQEMGLLRSVQAAAVASLGNA